MARFAPRPRWLRLALFSSVSLVVVASAALVWVSRTANGQAGYGQMPAFQLVDQTGRTRSSAELKGKFLAVDFIYTSCADVCPLVTSRMAALQTELRKDGLLGGSVQLVSITVDPERDTPAVLARYAQEHGADTATWSFLTGDLNRIQSLVGDGFKVAYNKVSPTAGTDGGMDMSGTGTSGSAMSGMPGMSGSDTSGSAPAPSDRSAAGAAGADPYLVAHTEQVVLVDPSGAIRAYYDGETLDPSAVIADIQKLR